jgi:2-polyprenyl-3-methyl-5-hydroxy-6-metoxy-1,4-benzoquinol methylase
MNFKKRSYKLELLDEDNIPQNALFQNLLELNFINNWLGGHDVVLAGIKQFFKIKGYQFPNNQSTNYLITEIGSGGGDNLRAIATWAKKKNINAKLLGIDLKKDCVDFAEKHNNNPQISFQTSDYQLVTFPDGKPDIIFNSLFCHHFREDDLVKMLRWMHENSTKGFVIADLHRHPLAYYSIKFLTKLFSKSYLVKNDAPLSVLRGFTRQEWQILLEKAEINNYKIQWKWAFRHLISVHHK